MPFARTIKEEPLVATRLDKARKKYPRLDEMWEVVTWKIARKPSVGVAIPGSNPQRFVYKSLPWKAGGVPSMTLLYQMTENEIIIEASQISDDE